MSQDPIDLGERGQEIVAQVNERITEAVGPLATAMELMGARTVLDEVKARQGTDHDAVMGALSGLTDLDKALLTEVTRQGAAQDTISTTLAGIRSDVTKILDLLTEDEPPPPPPPPPPGPWTLRTEIPCDRIDRSLIYVYDGWDPDNGQGPRDTTQLVVETEDGASFLRFRSAPSEQDVAVWNKRGKFMVTFPAGSYVSAGASVVKIHGSMTYGAVEMEVRAVQASKGTRIACLPGWPDGAPGWPSREEDYPEVSGDGDDQARQRVGWNGHYKDASGAHKQHQQTFPVNMLEWHTYRWEWSPDLLVVYIDGTEVGRRTEHVPTDPMYPCIQTALQSADINGLARPGTTPGGVDVRAWRVYDWTP